MTETEYVALSTVLREVIGITHLLEDLKLHGLPIHESIPTVKCRTFGDNTSCVNMVNNHRTQPRT